MSNNFENDIADLCQVAGINTSNYLHFARTRAVAEPQSAVASSHSLPTTHENVRQIIHPGTVLDPLASSEIAAESTPSEAHPKQSLTQPEPHPTTSATINKPVEITTRTNRFSVRKPMNRGERWQGLQAALDESNLPANTSHSHQTTNILLFPSSGGVGITTIAATLGRILSANKSPVGIIENSHQSLVPMHFGAKGVRTGCSTFFVSRSTNAAPVHLITPRPLQESKVPLLGTAASHSDTEEWVTDGLNLVGNECEYLMVDTWANMSIDLLNTLSTKSVCLIPLLPDVRSTLRVRPILDVFHNLSLKTGSRLEPLFVLSKFDHNVSLHTDLRKWLGEQLKSRLLPIVIRRSDEVSEALAEGETIVDYAPNSGVSEDFHRLAEWLQSRSQSNDTATYSRSAATGD